MNDSNGLDPSEYAGGGSLSSSFLDDSPLVSCGNAAFVSARVSDDTAGSLRPTAGSRAKGAYAGTEADAPASVTACLYASTASKVVEYSDEKGGGRGDGGGEEEEASERGY